jgi:PiT family inorganic phosphate transporter
MLVWFLLAVIFVLSVIFTWTNGVQHSSAVAAGAVGTHSLERGQLIAVICIFEIVGTLLGGSAVADVIQSLSAWPEDSSLLPLLCSALLAAILWNLLSRRFNIPSSSTHALIGGIIGALFAGAWNFEYVKMGQFDPIHPSGVIGAWISLIFSPMLGFLAAYALFCIVLILSLSATAKAEDKFRHAQWLTTAALAFGDGQNDTQKTMGLLVLALNGAGLLSGHDIPIWVRIFIALPMGLAAFRISPGIAKKLAFNVYCLRPMHAAVAEVSSAAILVSNSLIGGPVSASQVISASIMGTGAAERNRGIHWLVVKDILLSWLITIPGSAVVALIIHMSIFQWFQKGL